MTDEEWEEAAKKALEQCEFELCRDECELFTRGECPAAYLRED